MIPIKFTSSGKDFLLLDLLHYISNLLHMLYMGTVYLKSGVNRSRLDPGPRE